MREERHWKNQKKYITLGSPGKGILGLIKISIPYESSAISFIFSYAKFKKKKKKEAINLKDLIK